MDKRVYPRIWTIFLFSYKIGKNELGNYHGRVQDLLLRGAEEK